MRKLLLAGAALLLTSGAQAAETRFMCGSEQAINTIAEKLVVGQEAADEVATPYLTQGVCMYLPQDLHIDIVYHGKFYGQKKMVVEIVGFMDSDGTHMLYGMMQRDVLTI